VREKHNHTTHTHTHTEREREKEREREREREREVHIHMHNNNYIIPVQRIVCPCAALQDHRTVHLNQREDRGSLIGWFVNRFLYKLNSKVEAFTDVPNFVLRKNRFFTERERGQMRSLIGWFVKRIAIQTSKIEKCLWMESLQ